MALTTFKTFANLAKGIASYLDYNFDIIKNAFGQAGGFATLDGSIRVPLDQIPTTLTGKTASNLAIQGHVGSKNAALINLALNAYTEVLTLNIGEVSGGDVIQVNASCGLVAGQNSGQNYYQFKKSSGTAVFDLYYPNGVNQTTSTFYGVASTGYNLNNSYLLRVTTGGTCVLGLSAKTQGQSGFVGIGEAVMSAFFLKKG